MKYSILLLVALAAIFSSCNNMSRMSPEKRHEAMRARMDSLRADLLKTDMAFSEYSEQKGRNAAFIEYAADNATSLRPYSMPLTGGKDSLMSHLSRFPDTSIVLTWIPVRADVARSGDLGFTYGTYSLEIKNAGKEEGTYCFIWKKDKNHQWKFVLDTGNEGLKAEDRTEDKAVREEVKKEAKKKG